LHSAASCFGFDPSSCSHILAHIVDAFSKNTYIIIRLVLVVVVLVIVFLLIILILEITLLNIRSSIIIILISWRLGRIEKVEERLGWDSLLDDSGLLCVFVVC